ncbi:MAG: 10 kDa chaperonin [Pirellulaceae bacterium]|nr:MAG: 10 kDa chaperonin [Pirellulaceae bacterium]
MATQVAEKGKSKQTKLRLEPLGDRVVIERDDTEERTAGGIVLPDTAKEKLNRGRVLAVGPGKLLKNGERVPLQVKVGDHVLFSKYAGDEFKVGEDEYVLVREEDILAVVED